MAKENGRDDLKELGEVNSHNSNHFPKVYRCSQVYRRWLIPSVPRRK